MESESYCRVNGGGRKGEAEEKERKKILRE